MTEKMKTSVESGFTLLETLFSVSILSLCISLGILGMNMKVSCESEKYAEEMLRDLHLYKEEEYISGKAFKFEISRNGYSVVNEEGETVKEKILENNIIIDSNIKNDCISFTDGNIIINNTGIIEFFDLSNRKSHKITIIPTTGRMTVKEGE